MWRLAALSTLAVIAVIAGFVILHVLILACMSDGNHFRHCGSCLKKVQAQLCIVSISSVRACMHYLNHCLHVMHACTDT